MRHPPLTAFISESRVNRLTLNIQNPKTTELMPNYDIVINRTEAGTTKGILRFIIDGVEQFSTDCWEDPGNLIPNKDYHSCSATIMASKGYKSIFLPDDQTGKKGIFIHQGGSPTDSDGCIVCAKSRVEQIYDAITPKDGRNVAVRITTSN